MLVLITYDVNTKDADGRKRLRQIAKQCVDYEQRVQNSVFECVVDAAQAKTLRHKLCAQYFVDQVKLSAAAMLEPDMVTELAVQDTTELIASAAILSGLSRLFAEKLLLLKDKTLETGGSIEIIE